MLTPPVYRGVRVTRYIVLCVVSCGSMFVFFVLFVIVLVVLLFTGSHYPICNRIGGVMVSVLASNAIDRGFESRSGQTKDYEIGICCFSAKHAALRRKRKDWLARNQNNASEWSDMSTCGLLFQ